MDIKLPNNIKNIDINKNYQGDNKLIHLIIYQKNNALLDQYLKYNYDLNLVDFNLNTPYHILLTYMFDIDLFKKIINDKVCWNNKNSSNISILDLILTNKDIFHKLKKYHHYFMKKDILDSNKENYNNICKFLDSQDIIDYSNIINFKADIQNPPLFDILHNKNIKHIDKTIQKIYNINKDIIHIKDFMGDNLLGKFIFNYKDLLNKNNRTNIINKFIDIGFQPNYQNPITGTQPFKLLLIYINDKTYLLDYFLDNKIDPNIIDNYGNNLGLFTIFLYNKKQWITDKLFHTIINKSDKLHKNLDDLSIQQIFYKNYKGQTNDNIKINLIDINLANTNHFRSRLDDILFYFMVLDNKYKNLHIPKFNKNISNKNLDFDSNSISLPTDLHLTLDMLPFFITFMNTDTYYIHPYLNLLIKGLSKKYPEDYAIVFLSLHDEESNLHANILFYNFKEKTITRFEPYGDTFIIDENIDEILQEELTWNLNFKYIKPSDYTNGSGLQSLSDDNNISNQKPGDFGGFCLAWSLWFVEMKLQNENISNKDLIYKSLRKIIKKNSLVDYIRSYGNKISELKYYIYKKINLPKEIWTNITFNHEQNQIILDEIIKFISI